MASSHTAGLLAMAPKTAAALAEARARVSEQTEDGPSTSSLESSPRSGSRKLTQMTRVQLNTAAFVAPMDVYRSRVPRRARLYAVSAVGVGHFECVHEGEVHLSGVGADGAEGVGGIERSDAEGALCVPGDLAGEGDGDKLLPPAAASLVAQAQRRSARLHQSSEMWDKLFGGFVAALIPDQLQKVPGDTDSPFGSADAATVAAAAAMAGIGHRAMRVLAHLVEGQASSAHNVSRVAKSVLSEYSRQCQHGGGSKSVRLAVEAVCAAAGSRAPKQAGERKLSAAELSAVDNTNCRAYWMQEVTSAVDRTIEMASAARVECVDFLSALPHTGEKNAYCMSGGSSRGDWLFSSRQVEDSVTSGCSTLDAGGSAAQFFSSMAPANEAERLQFWDGYLAFREMGSYSREIAGSVTIAKGDDFEDSSREMELECDLPSSKSAVKADLAFKVFRSLSERRNKPQRLALRRPVAATAKMTPRIGKRNTLPAGDEESAGLPSTNQSSSCPGQEAVRPGSKERPQKTPESQLQTAELPLLPPMFMGGSLSARNPQMSLAAQSHSMALPFVSNGVSFSRPIFAQPVRSPRKSPSTLATDVIVDPPPALERNAPKLVDASDSSRCAYCKYHQVECRADAPVETWKRIAAARLVRNNSRGMGNDKAKEETQLCLACGGNLAAGFRLRPPPIEFRELADARGWTIRLGTVGSSNKDAVAEWPGVRSNTADAISPRRSSIVAVSQRDAAVCSSTALLGSVPAAFATPPSLLLGADHGAAKRDCNGVYFQSCERLHARPVAHAAAAMSETIESISSTITISLRGAELDDQALRAMLDGLSQRIAAPRNMNVSIDLARNRLTDSGIKELVGRLEPMQWAPRLELLDVGGNRQLTVGAIAPFCALLHAGKFPRFRVLRMTGVGISEGFAQELARSIEAGASSTLCELDLSFSGLGRMGLAGPMAIASLVRQCSDLRVLDLSGNHFQVEGAAALGRSLAATASVRALHMAHNTGKWPLLPNPAGPPGRDSGYAAARLARITSRPFAPSAGCAIGALCEQLPSIWSLKLLDIRASQVDPRSAFILAQAIYNHGNLESVLLNRNPLGNYGVHALVIAALSGIALKGGREDFSLLTFDQIDEQNIVSRDKPPLSLVDPSGTYCFDLRDIWARAAVVFCLHRWSTLPSRVQPPFDQAFQAIDLDGKAFREPGRHEDGTWELPSEGILSFTALLPQPTAPPSIAAPARDRYRQNMTEAQEARALQLASACREPEALFAIARALAAHFFLRIRVVRALWCWLGEASAYGRNELYREAAEILLDAAELGDVGGDAKEAEILLFSLLDRVRPPPPHPVRPGPRDPTTTFFFLAPDCPTGRYVLNLSAPAENLAAEQLCLLSAWVAATRMARGAPDVSQSGNYQCFRNEALNCERFVFCPEWAPPSSGILEFDFAWSERPPKAAKAMRDEAWGRFLEAFDASELPVPVRALCLRRLASALILTCQQVLTLLQKATTLGDNSALAGRPFVQQLFLAALFFRIRDYANAWSTFFVKGAPLESPGQLAACETMLGRLNIFDPVQAHARAPMLLRLHSHEDRQMLRLLLEIAFKEGGKAIDPKSFPGCLYGPVDTERRALALLASGPPEWWAKTGPPLYGVLLLAYAGGQGTVSLRRRVAKLFLGWDL